MVAAEGNTNLFTSPFLPAVFRSCNKNFHVFQFIFKFPFPCSFSSLHLGHRLNFVPFQVKRSNLGLQAWLLKTLGCCSGCEDFFG